jgi:hypothetical protein
MEDINLEQEKRNRRERGLRQAGILPGACGVAPLTPTFSTRSSEGNLGAIFFVAKWL